MQRHVEACKTHDALKQAVGLCLHATLTAPQRAERDRVEPERRAERQRAAAAHAKASSELAVGAAAGGAAGVGVGADVSAEAGVGDAGDAGDANETGEAETLAAAAAAKAARISPASAIEGWMVGKAPATLRVDLGRRVASEGTAGGAHGRGGDGGGSEGAPEGEAAVSMQMDDIEDPGVIAAQVAAAAALLGDCCLPYVTSPVVSELFL
jgi:hypothetical protein